MTLAWIVACVVTLVAYWIGIASIDLAYIRGMSSLNYVTDVAHLYLFLFLFDAYVLFFVISIVVTWCQNLLRTRVNY